MNPDGWITIGTKLDTKQLEKELTRTQRELEKFDKENEKLITLKTKVELDLHEYEKQKQLIEEATDSSLKKAFTEEQVNEELKMEEMRLQELNEQYSHQFEELNNINKKIDDNNQKQEQAKQKIMEINSELNRTNGFSSIQDSISNIGSSLGSVAKKVVKWGLAVFGVRSAYMFVRQAMSTLSGYNEQLATDVQYIRFALATTLEPIITRLIQLVYKFLHLVANIIYYFFRINIFAGATKDAFQKTNKTAGELKKTLAGFDEMNILNDNGSANGLGSGIGDISDDLSKLGEIEPFDLQTWLKKMKKTVNNFLDDVKKTVTNWLKKANFSEQFIKYWELGITGVKNLFNGLVDFANGVLELIVGIFTGDTKKIKKGFEDMFKGIKEFFIGFQQTIQGGFGMLVQWIIDIFKKLPETIYNLFIKKSGQDFDTFKAKAKGTFDEIFQKVQNTFTNVFNVINNTIERIRGSLSNLGTNAGNIIGGALKAVVNGILSAIENILNTPIRTINSLISTVNKILPVKLGKLSTFSLPRLAQGGIINMPGRGVPIGSAIGGESGKEGVIPLTDSQQMALLGEAIGKYITVNATIVNSMNGRVLNRELQRIQNQTSFATNGR